MAGSPAALCFGLPSILRIGQGGYKATHFLLEAARSAGCKATDGDDATVDPRFGKIGKQTIVDTGALTKKRMERVVDDFAGRSVDFIKRQNAAGKPFFVWVNFTHMHFRTHVKPESVGPARPVRRRIPQRDD